MKNMEREKFEASWRNAFENAEIAPSEKVWTNIELDLEKEKGGSLKRRLLFFQMLAAASVVFAMSIGGAALYYTLSTSAVDGVALDTRHETVTPSGPGAPAGADKDELSETATERVETHASSGQHRALTGEDALKRPGIGDVAQAGDNATVTRARRDDESPSLPGDENTQQAAIAGPDRERLYPELPRTVNDDAVPASHLPEAILPEIPATTRQQEMVDPVVAMLALVEQREKEVQEEKDRRERGAMDENLWTSVGFAAGSFSNMQSSASNPAPSGYTMTLAAPIVDQETKASGYSYSMGVNIGTKLSGRWVFQGGVNYLTHASEYTANNVVVSGNNFEQQRFRAVSTNELINSSDEDLSNKIVYSAPYNVNNSMRYLSIPLQAGYLLVNKTFGLQLNAGVATDVFLQNTVTADSDKLDKISQAGGSDSPYRGVNLSGLFGTEFSYRFGQHYRVALNPGIRYPFNTIYKSELGVDATPLTFDVGLRFRYIFR